jgi:hypothetical protein
MVPVPIMLDNNGDQDFSVWWSNPFPSVVSEMPTFTQTTLPKSGGDENSKEMRLHVN